MTLSTFWGDDTSFTTSVTQVDANGVVTSPPLDGFTVWLTARRSVSDPDPPLFELTNGTGGPGGSGGSLTNGSNVITWNVKRVCITGSLPDVDTTIVYTVKIKSPIDVEKTVERKSWQIKATATRSS